MQAISANRLTSFGTAAREKGRCLERWRCRAYFGGYCRPQHARRSRAGITRSRPAASARRSYPRIIIMREVRDNAAAEKGPDDAAHARFQLNRASPSISCSDRATNSNDANSGRSDSRVSRQARSWR